MKYFYLTIAFFISLNSFSQNDLLGEWFLHYIEINGVQQYSTIPLSYSNVYSYNNLIFNNNGSFNGQVCNEGTSGNYNLNNDNTINLSNFGGLVGNCGYVSEWNHFLSPYLSIFNSDSGFGTYYYSITGMGVDEFLVLTNEENNSAVYGRTRLPESRLPGVWFLHSIVRNGNETINSYNQNINVDFTLYSGFFSDLVYYGDAVCNSYQGNYYLENYIDKRIRIGYFQSTLTECSTIEANDFEASYYSFFNDSPNANFSLLDYSITGSGDDETLILTDQDGDYLIYGRQTLSISENHLNNLNIRLIENPVKNELSLIIHESLGNHFNYQVYSVDGKQIIDSTLLRNTTINVENLNSGMYFLVVSSENNFRQTLKFIKE